VNKETRITQDALEQLNRILNEVGGWIIRESEKLASNGGKKTIDVADIRDATKLYLGLEAEKHGD
jgi:histone H3/H4